MADNEEMSNPFEHYPCQAGTHSDCPMWVMVIPAGNGWIRLIDGAHLRRGPAFWVLQFVGQEDVITLRAGQVAGIDEEGNANPICYEDGAALEYVDREYPPPAPPVRIGQVWVITEDDGTAEVEITSIMRFEQGPAVILPHIETDGVIGHQAIGWLMPPVNAIMVRDFDGPKVWVPPTWGT